MFKEKLQSTGYKLTTPRIKILDLLEQNHNPLSAAQIHKKLKRKVDLASIYRTLNILKKIGIAFEELRNDTEYYYLDEKQHHHVVCKKCGYTECLPCKHIFSNIKNFSNISHKLTITGICKNCS